MAYNFSVYLDSGEAGKGTRYSARPENRGPGRGGVGWSSICNVSETWKRCLRRFCGRISTGGAENMTIRVSLRFGLKWLGARDLDLTSEKWDGK